MQQKVLRSVGVHDGMFHADEVTACALLVLFNLVDEEKIVRTRDSDKLAQCEYVCDVGGIYDPEQKLFDHHQISYQGPLSSAGMILTYLRDKNVIDLEEHLFFQGSLMRGVDEHDNGKAPQHPGMCTFSHIVANFAPITYTSTPVMLNALFMEAFHFALGHLRRLRERFIYTKSCRVLVQAEMEKNRRCLVFDEALPWLESFFALGGKEHRALFVIMPSQGHWKLRGIPPDYEHRMQVRIPLPQQWAGLLSDELQEKSKIAGAIFCHKGRFISVWETKADALAALHTVLEQEGIADEHSI